MMTMKNQMRPGADKPDLNDPAVIECPYAAYDIYREQAAVHKVAEGRYMVMRYDDVREGLSNHELFSRDTVGFFDPDRPSRVDIIWKCPEARRLFAEEGWQSWPQAAALNTDPPLHTRFRKFVDPMFSMKRVREMTPYIQDLIDDLIDGFIDKGEADFVQEFAVPLPMHVICDRLGFPKEDLDRLKFWSIEMSKSVSFTMTPEEEVACARNLVDCQRYMVAQLEHKRRHPADDILSEIAQIKPGAESGFEMGDILSLISSILIGGNESTTNALSSGLWLLLRNPDVLAALKENPDLTRNFVEENLRLESPFQYFLRAVRQDTDLHGVTLKKGDLLDVRLGAANRDPRQYPQPDKIDLKRPGITNHLAFGAGVHRCLGNMLARTELALAFQTLLRRLDNIQLSPKNTYEHMPHAMFRGLTALYITFDKAA